VTALAASTAAVAAVAASTPSMSVITVVVVVDVDVHARTRRRGRRPARDDDRGRARDDRLLSRDWTTTPRTGRGDACTLFTWSVHNSSLHILES